MNEKDKKDEKDGAVIKNHPLPNCFSEELLLITRGDGVWLEDRTGKRYLDFAGGIAVNALGYGREDLALTAYRQMQKLTHISNLFITEPALELSQKMIKSGDFQAVQFLNSGSEANETALKFARLYALRKKGQGNHKLLCFKGSFHGRTFGALSVTPNSKYQDPFLPLVPGVEVAEYNSIDVLERIVDKSFAGIIVEVIQGEGGLDQMTADFAEALNRVCIENDVILIADEVQTGLSRTGSFFASHAVGLKPDIFTLAKPLAGGLPLSAVLIPEKINKLIHTGEHGTTFGGGPVTTAVASVVWDILIDRGFIQQVRERGEDLRDALGDLKSSFPFLGEIKGRGLLMGIEVQEDMLTRCKLKFQEQGLITLISGQNVLRIAPPLVITKKEIEIGINIIKKVFKKINE